MPFKFEAIDPNRLADLAARIGRSEEESHTETLKRLSNRASCLLGEKVNAIATEDVKIGDFFIHENCYGSSLICVISSITQIRYIGIAANGEVWSYPKNSSDECIPFTPSEKVLRNFFDNLNSEIEWGGSCDHTQELVHIAEEHYPNYFAKLNLERCSECGDFAIPKITVNGVALCQSCYDKRYVSCRKCGKTIPRQEACMTRDSRTLCKECNKRHWILPYHCYYPEVEFYGDNKNNTVPFMGFELEVDCGGEDDNKAAKIMPLLNKEDSGKIFAYCSHDGSLTEGGFEIITQPATLQYHSSISDVYNRAIQKLKTMGYASHETTTCGFHVHFNRSFFDGDEENCIRRLVFMTEKFWDELCIFARRPERRLTHYAKKIPKGMEISEYMRRANRSGNHDYHYYAINIANNDTIEFRIFRGTLNLNTIMATLQLVNTMVIFAKTKTMDEIKAMRFENLLTTPTQHKYWMRHKAISDFEE